MNLLFEGQQQLSTAANPCGGLYVDTGAGTTWLILGYDPQLRTLTCCKSTVGYISPLPVTVVMTVFHNKPGAAYVRVKISAIQRALKRHGWMLVCPFSKGEDNRVEMPFVTKAKISKKEIW